MQLADTPLWGQVVRAAYGLSQFNLEDQYAKLSVFSTGRGRMASGAPYLTDGGFSGAAFSDLLGSKLSALMTEQALECVLLISV